MLVDTAVAAIEEIANFQQQQGMSNPTRLVDFKSITAGNCSENMGEENGVIAKIQQLRKAQWEELFPNKPYEELIIKGCTDHIMALIPQHFQKVITTRARVWNIKSLLSTVKSSNNVLQTLG